MGSKVKASADERDTDIEEALLSLKSKKKTVDSKDAYFYLFGDIDDTIAQDFCKRVIENNIDKSFKKLYVLVNSYGGSVTAAFAMIDCIKGSAIKIETIGIGAVWSAALFIFMSGNKRALTPNTSILSHQFSAWAYGKQHELIAQGKEFGYTDERILNLYRSCTGLKDKIIKQVLLKETDVWLTAAEAKKYGICDKVIDLFAK